MRHRPLGPQLLTLEAAATRGLDVAGVVISHAGGPLSDADAANLGSLSDCLGARLIGIVPPLAPGEVPSADAIDLRALPPPDH